MSTKPLVFVTGASGFLGSVVVNELLEAGYPVRGAARGRKVAQIETAFASYGAQFQAVEIADNASSDFTEALKGVGAIIHTAAPIPGRTDFETGLKSSVEGSLRIVRAAQKAGISRVVMTGSTVTFPKADEKFGPDDWVEVTKEQAAAPDADQFTRYIAQKKYSEQAVLQYADENPDMDITILNPTWIFGPLAPGFEALVPTPEGAFATFGTNGFIYQLLRADNKNYHYTPGTIDVRDVARIHIAALNAPTPNGKRVRRQAIVSPYDTGFRDAIKYIYDERPELRGRLADPQTVPKWPKYRLDGVDLGVVERDFGFPVSKFKTWKETILDSVDRFIQIEESWKAKGYTFEVPTDVPV
uniref:NAD-dependent epimerase/dehydratase domain-containing protein n=1 Tax=Mycena chlorophos TaxID=658473 RepID=A0ABQ0LFL8_MYCCL|nr:predicted protein [Mycena chlorophos]